MRFKAFLGLLCVVSAATADGQTVSKGVDFNREVRPILSQHCFKCHGPDEKQRAAGLRLDERAAALAPLKSGRRAIVPGKPQQSGLAQRIFASGALQMPPAHANKPLSPAQKEILKRWVASGAEYKAHWAFVPPKQASLPKVRQRAWTRTGIDYFILARLEAAGLKPSPEADRYTLARRAFLDLIGLPPTPEEADAFVQDKRPDAYERMIDRLLASPHYGERWARRWLDLARYADTNGYEKDRPRSIWLYRDWVIQALNRDTPFDRFTIAQLAGDMLPNATIDQRIATGFNRNTMLNEEGGVDPLEFRFHAMTDRIATTGTAWLGLTVGCAQCHTHKYDPLPQRDYYRMMAFLDNADEPEIEVKRPEITAQRNKIEAEATAREAQLAEKFPAADGLTAAQNRERKFAEWLTKETNRAVRWQTMRPTKAVSNLPLLTIQPDQSVIASGDQTKRDVYDLTFPTMPAGVTALRLEVLPDESLPKQGPGRIAYEGPIGDFFLSEFQLMVNGKPVRFVKASQSFASGGNTAQVAIDGDPQTGWSVAGGQGKAHTAVFLPEKPLEGGVFALRLLFERYYAAGLGRFRLAFTTDARPVEAFAPPDVEEILTRADSERTPAQRQRLLQQFLAVAPELAKERGEIAKLREQTPAYPTTLVFLERPANNPRLTLVRRRGEFLQPAERVTPGLPAFLSLAPQETPKDRLTFAQWLVSEKNPLVGRVTVNREWAAFFGRGLVRTQEDFGYQGELPTHPELLDWLAVEFQKRGWSLKKLHRLIVTSATYRQSSRVSPALLAKDPENRLLARGARVRLDAELVRDAALTISGLLSRKIGGQSVFPPQPAGVTTEGTYGPLTWNVSQGEDRYRRGLYTFAKRTAPYAMFTTFDAPSGEATCPRRERSNTPLQALTLLNDQVFVETAQAVGKTLATRPGSVEERIVYLFRRCVTRPPTAQEQTALTRFFETQQARFAQKELDAAAIGGAGEGDANERAVWTTLARALLNLDEVVVKR